MAPYCSATTTIFRSLSLAISDGPRELMYIDQKINAFRAEQLSATELSDCFSCFGFSSNSIIIISEPMWEQYFPTYKIHEQMIKWISECFRFQVIKFVFLKTLCRHKNFGSYVACLIALYTFVAHKRCKWNQSWRFRLKCVAPTSTHNMYLIWFRWSARMWQRPNIFEWMPQSFLVLYGWMCDRNIIFY